MKIKQTSLLKKSVKIKGKREKKQNPEKPNTIIEVIKTYLE